MTQIYRWATTTTTTTTTTTKAASHSRNRCKHPISPSRRRQFHLLQVLATPFLPSRSLFRASSLIHFPSRISLFSSSAPRHRARIPQPSLPSRTAAVHQRHAIQPRNTPSPCSLFPVRPAPILPSIPPSIQSASPITKHASTQPSHADSCGVPRRLRPRLRLRFALRLFFLGDLATLSSTAEGGGRGRRGGADGGQGRRPWEAATSTPWLSPAGGISE